jgi:hypothetical protein
VTQQRNPVTKSTSTKSAMGLQVWRALALSSSGLALVLTLTRHSGPAPLAVSLAKPAASEATPLELPVDVSPSLSAVSALAETGAETALDALIGIHQRGAPEVASAALHGIAQIGGRRAREYVAQRFADASASELPDLAQALAEMGGRDAHDLLRSAARSPRSPAAEAAREALASLDTPDARDFMLEELSSALPEQNQTEAVAYFADCQDARATPALERLIQRSSVDLRRTAIESLFAQGDDAGPAVERLLREGDELSNSMLESPAPTAALRQAQRDASIARLRAGAITSGPVFDFLARDLSVQAGQALAQAARDPASRDSALSALSTRGDSASLNALAELADDRAPELASRAACALLSAPDSRSHTFLLRVGLKLRGDAAAALLSIDAPEGPAALARLTASSEPGEREEAEHLTARYGFGS